MFDYVQVHEAGGEQRPDEPEVLLPRSREFGDAQIVYIEAQPDAIVRLRPLNGY